MNRFIITMERLTAKAIIGMNKILPMTFSCVHTILSSSVSRMMKLRLQAESAARKSFPRFGCTDGPRTRLLTASVPR